MSEIFINVDPEDVPIVNITVDENSAQSAIDAAAAALAIFQELQNSAYGGKLDKGGYLGTAKNLDDRINDLAFPDEIITRGPVLLENGSVSISATDFKVRINQNIVTNPIDYNVVINPAALGFNRTDIVIIDQNGVFSKIQGQESADIAVKPVPSADTLEITSINIIGNSILSPIPSDNSKLNRDGYNGTAMTLHREITSLDEDLNTRIDDVAYEINEIKLPLKADKLTTYTKIETDNFITQLLGGAPADANTLKELNDKILAVQAIIGSADPDGNLLVDTVKELLAVFSTFPEGVDLVNLLAGKVNTTDVYNALNSVVAGKVLDARQGKVLKDLIDALTTTVSNISSNVVTTIKPIFSTALASQNVAGFVTYINALNPVLVVGTSEIVKYNLTDTGRVFELNLRGRSFGVGQPAIVAADVLEVTDFLNKDIRLSNYPSTRNDGQLPTNRVLSTDANGNLKMYTIATSPAPYLEVLIPDSTLPSTTTNFTLKGAFFTPTMTVAIAGQTINYVTFKSDNLVLVNVTTGATEGSYAVTLNNGIQAVFPNALLIVLGTVFTPTSADWINVTGSIDLSSGNNARVLINNTYGSATINPSFVLTKGLNLGNYSFRFNFVGTPLNAYPIDAFNEHNYIELVGQADGLVKYKLHSQVLNEVPGKIRIVLTDSSENLIFSRQGDSSLANCQFLKDFTFEIKRISNSIGIYINNVLVLTPTVQFTGPMFIRSRVYNLDIENIKYIELTS